MNITKGFKEDTSFLPERSNSKQGQRVKYPKGDTPCGQCQGGAAHKNCKGLRMDGELCTCACPRAVAFRERIAARHKEDPSHTVAQLAAMHAPSIYGSRMGEEHFPAPDGRKRAASGLRALSDIPARADEAGEADLYPEPY